MPNKRKDGLVTLSAWIETELKEEIRQMAKEEGISMSELATRIIEEQVERRKEKRK